MAFRKKTEVILRYQPHILIVPECECPDRCSFSPEVPQPTDRLWYGTNRHKGLGIFSYGDFRFTEHGCHHPDFKMVVPISVTGGRTALNLFAIWANNPVDKVGRILSKFGKRYSTTMRC
jgi:exodeoxyribonuclease-3